MPINIFTTLDDPSATLNDPVLTKGTAARGINGTGQIVGLFSDSSSRPNHGFLFSGGSFITLDDPLALTITEAFGVNDSGQIVGFYNDASGIHGFLRSSSGSFTPLDVPTTTHGTEALGINNQGSIVGDL
jgi:probable HAF family extracellular repeat protein